MKSFNLSVKVLFAVMLGILLPACSGVGFGTKAADAVPVSQNSTPDLPPAPQPSPAPVNTPQTHTDVEPKIAFQIPDCKANTLCVVTVQLNQPASLALQFNWKTDDTKYQSDPVTYATPNVNYVPAGGTVLFTPGSTVQYIRIQSLSGFTHILIPFNWDTCSLGGVPIDCATLQ